MTAPNLRIAWTPEDRMMLRQAYDRSVGAESVVLPDELIERHTRLSCQQQASKLGITRKSRPRQPDVPFTLAPTDAAYLAGIIDGEGHVAYGKAWLQVTSTTPVITDWCARTVPIGRLQKPWQPPNQNAKVVHRWLLSTIHGCKRLYAQLLPFVLIETKREAMQWVIDFDLNVRRDEGYSPPV